MTRSGTRTAALLALALGATLTAGTAAQAAPESDVELTVGDISVSTEVSPTKINVMGLWAHPDDDAGFTTPCGVWQDLYDITCGIIMETRGEGGSNSVGPEAGPDLGLRRENEDRTSHYRSGTVNIYNVDRVDFFYNLSAPLTAEVWDKEQGLRQTVRILRETQPDILMASSPFASGHGNHQYAQGRMVWEASVAAADPNMYPDQLTGPDAVDVWQVKKIIGIGSTSGSGGVNGENCNAGFTPSASNPYTVVGTWTGYPSPYTWVEGNVQGQEAGTFKTWAQVGREGGRAHPTQARAMEKGTQSPNCQRYAVAKSLVPIQPNSSPAAGQDNAILFGATIPDPGGMPLGSTFTVEAEDFFAAPGVPFDVTVSARSGEGTIANGQITLDVPAGWTVSAPRLSGPITDSATVSKTFTVTPAADAASAVNRISASFDNGVVTAYNDTRVQVVQQVEGKFQRWGNQVEYEQWADEYTWLGGLSRGYLKIGAGESVTLPVVVTNRSNSTKSGTVELTMPAGLVADRTSDTFTGLAAGQSTTIDFVVTHGDVTALASTANLRIETTADGITTEDVVAVTIVPTAVIPELAAAPTIDGQADEYGSAPALNLSGRWEGGNCSPNGVDCGNGSVAYAGWYGDALYIHARVVDDKASGAATPDRCFGHWLVDSVEILLDPQGDSVDTSTTFKSGIFPFTDDAENYNGNGVNGPCWSRDADHHQGFSTGPLSEVIKGGPNSIGQEVAARAVFDPETREYEDGAWEVEAKIPLANLPAAILPASTPPTGDAATNVVDPQYLGLNITPYDSDVTTFIGKTRTAWSAVGGQQAEPFKWGHAYLDGYTPPADRPTTAAPAIIPDTALQSVESPQSVYQSATRGVTLSGQQPSRAMTIDGVTISSSSVDVEVTSTTAGTARVFLWNGEEAIASIPVWTSSCPGMTAGFDACSPEDGAAPPWGTNMGGHLLGKAVEELTAGSTTVSVAIDADTFATLAEDSFVLVSFEDPVKREVAAFSMPIIEKSEAAPVFADVLEGQDFYEDIRWMAETGLSTGTVTPEGTFFYPNNPVSRQAMAAFMYRFTGATFVPTEGTQTFSDVTDSHPFYKEIEWMASEGLSAGYEDGTYRSDAPVSRQAMTAFLYRLAGEPAVTGSASFSDVTADHEFAAAIAWAEQADVVNGYSDGTFRSATPVSRQATAALLHRFDQL